jgi:hypothetical protein
MKAKFDGAVPDYPEICNVWQNLGEKFVEIALACKFPGMREQ